MSDLPNAVHITEEGPREGFQIEKGPISTARKIALIDALSQTGLDRIQIVSFVNPKAVPGMADADDVVRGIAKGESNKDIAWRLGLSEQTVKNYLRRIFEKLNVANRVELALHAFEKEMIDDEIGRAHF